MAAVYQAVLGGVLIGAASWLVMFATGRIPGVSGVFSRACQGRRGDTAWRVVFLVGLVVGAGAAMQVFPPAAAFHPVRSLPVLVAAGLLVGFGTRLGGGCTSGHGVCGLGMASRTALIATLLFMGAGLGTVAVMRLGGFAPFTP